MPNIYPVLISVYLDPTEEGDFPLFTAGQEYILTFLVPALIIVAMLLFAILIACLLHR